MSVSILNVITMYMLEKLHALPLDLFFYITVILQEILIETEESCGVFFSVLFFPQTSY